MEADCSKRTAARAGSVVTAGREAVDVLSGLSASRATSISFSVTLPSFAGVRMMRRRRASGATHSCVLRTVYSTSQMIRIFGTVLAALAGLAFGSFLNVCLSRWPAGESVVKPRSHCRSCGRTLPWWENVPLASWLALRGHCRTCAARISWRYPVVELAVGVLWAIITWRFIPELFDSRLPVIVMCHDLLWPIGALIFVWLLVALASLDAEHLWLPNWITFTGIITGSLIAIVQAALDALSPLHDTVNRLAVVKFEVGRAVFGILVAALISPGIILLIRWVYWLVRRREGIGLGDAKLMAMLGAWLGLPGALLAFAIGVVLGAVVAFVVLAVPAARRGHEPWALTKLPLGTFLCIGGIVSGLWGQQILAAYLRWSGLA
jgi:leader peptidase (prepilin peptidase) / N-methyltransferase